MYAPKMYRSYHDTLRKLFMKYHDLKAVFPGSVFPAVSFNFGPNATTFITPAEIFPTRVRSTGHGFSAGMGKLGAVFAQIFFAPMIKRGATHDNPTPWIHGVMQIFALFMFLGMLTSFLVPESKRARLEALAGEREEVEVEEDRLCDQA